MLQGLKLGLFAAIGAMVPLSGAVAASSPSLSQADKNIYIAAFAAAEKGNWQSAHALAARAKARLPAEVLDWIELTRGRTARDFASIAAFQAANPDWPFQRNLLQRAEEAMDERTPDRDVLAFFGGRTPLTTGGRLRLIDALLSAGERERATALIRETWVRGSFGRQQEADFRKAYGSVLTRADHAARLDYLLWRGRTTEAKSTIRLVDTPWQKLAMARMALRAAEGNVDWHIRQVPASLSNDPGLIYERIRWRRQKDRDSDAYDLLKGVPATTTNAEFWWTERAILARRMLAKGHISEAYRLASANGLSTGASFVEAEWLAGWIALRYLREPKVAGEHFRKIDSIVTYPISKARTAYWAGRAAEQGGDKAAAAAFFRKAAQFDTTYYGQLAAARHGGSVRLRAEPIEPTKEDIARFEADRRVQAVRLLHQIGAGEYLQAFVDTLADDAQTPAQFLLAANLGKSLGRPELAVRAGRKAQYAGILLPDHAYPVIDMPGGKPPAALLHAIARQESNFDPQAISPAGARGLMQLMPATAKGVARKLNIQYSHGRLITDPAYNVRLGGSYIDQMIERFDGSYILAIAAYNAGPSAARRWAKAFGDPGDPQTDPIDWVESIPYAETRNYVQRVLENLQVYRVRLDGPMLAEAIEKDLAR